ncbi:MAG: hypothetical protein KJP04_09180, partial [Arenicella sp.]|nr:hypothetical protein [Arenicella sp.]
VLTLCSRAGIDCMETNFSLSDVYSADEAFVTGTFAGLVPVNSVDGRQIGNASAQQDDKRGPMVKRLQKLYATMLDQECAGD